MSTFLDFFNAIIQFNPNAIPVGTVSDNTVLNDSQKSYVENSLRSDKLVLTYDQNGNARFNNGYLNNAITYSPNYKNPENSVSYLSDVYNLPDWVKIELTNAVKQNKTNKPFVKNTLAFINKNWREILAGTISVIVATQNKGNQQETDPNINPNTGLPYGEVPPEQKQGGGGAIQFLKDNALVIGVVSAIGIGAYYYSTSKKRR